MNHENERVRALRKDQRLTLEKFGEKLGITRSAVSNIESGNRSVTDQMRRSICREFGVREDWLRTGEGNMYEPQSQDALDALTAEFGFSAKERRVAEIFLTLDATRRKAALEYLSDVIDALNEEDAEEKPESEAAIHAREMAKLEIPEAKRMSEEEIQRELAEYEALLRGTQRLQRQFDVEKRLFGSDSSDFTSPESSGGPLNSENAG